MKQAKPELTTKYLKKLEAQKLKLHGEIDP